MISTRTRAQWCRRTPEPLRWPGLRKPGHHTPGAMASRMGKAHDGTSIGHVSHPARPSPHPRWQGEGQRPPAEGDRRKRQATGKGRAGEQPASLVHPCVPLAVAPPDDAWRQLGMGSPRGSFSMIGWIVRGHAPGQPTVRNTVAHLACPSSLRMPLAIERMSPTQGEALYALGVVFPCWRAERIHWRRSYHCTGALTHGVHAVPPGGGECQASLLRSWPPWPGWRWP